MKPVFVKGSFDNLRSDDLRFLEEASRLGPLTVLLLSDKAVEGRTGHPPRFPEEERRYLLKAVRWVNDLIMVDGPDDPDALPRFLHSATPEPGGEFADAVSSETQSGARDVSGNPSVPGGLAALGFWAVRESEDAPEKREFCRGAGLDYAVIKSAEMDGFPWSPTVISVRKGWAEGDDGDAGAGDGTSGGPGRERVVVTGSFDWFHSGHVRFFEEVSELGDLYVIVGHDENIKLLKGEGHPVFPATERRYMVASVRFVKAALITSGRGWLDAEPEIELIQPDLYVVNEDGDHPEKREFCRAHGIEYRVLKRLPKAGLPARTSTDLRGF